MVTQHYKAIIVGGMLIEDVRDYAAFITAEAGQEAKLASDLASSVMRNKE